MKTLILLEGQTENNRAKIERVQQSLKSYQITFNLTKEFVINKVDSLKYRGIELSNNTYTNNINSNLFILFELDNQTVNKIMKLKY